MKSNIENKYWRNRSSKNITFESWRREEKRETKDRRRDISAPRSSKKYDVIDSTDESRAKQRRQQLREKRRCAKLEAILKILTKSVLCPLNSLLDRGSVDFVTEKISHVVSELNEAIKYLSHKTKKETVERKRGYKYMHKYMHKYNFATEDSDTDDNCTETEGVNEVGGSMNKCPESSNISEERIEEATTSRVNSFENKVSNVDSTIDWVVNNFATSESVAGIDDSTCSTNTVNFEDIQMDIDEEISGTENLDKLIDNMIDQMLQNTDHKCESEMGNDVKHDKIVNDCINEHLDNIQSEEFLEQYFDEHFDDLFDRFFADNEKTDNGKKEEEKKEEDTNFQETTWRESWTETWQQTGWRSDSWGFGKKTTSTFSTSNDPSCSTSIATSSNRTDEYQLDELERKVNVVARELENSKLPLIVGDEYLSADKMFPIDTLRMNANQVERIDDHVTNEIVDSGVTNETVINNAINVDNGTLMNETINADNRTLMNGIVNNETTNNETTNNETTETTETTNNETTNNETTNETTNADNEKNAPVINFANESSSSSSSPSLQSSVVPMEIERLAREIEKDGKKWLEEQRKPREKPKFKVVSVALPKKTDEDDDDDDDNTLFKGDSKSIVNDISSLLEQIDDQNRKRREFGKSVMDRFRQKCSNSRSLVISKKRVSELMSYQNDLNDTNRTYLSDYIRHSKSLCVYCERELPTVDLAFNSVCEHTYCLKCLRYKYFERNMHNENVIRGIKRRNRFTTRSCPACHVRSSRYLFVYPDPADSLHRYRFYQLTPRQLFGYGQRDAKSDKINNSSNE